MSEVSLYITNYTLDEKRDSFARLMASGESPEKSYCIAFNSILSDEDAKEKAMELCKNPYVVEKISAYCEDRKVLNSINRQNVSVTLKRIIDVDASDFYYNDENGNFVLVPIERWTRSMKTAFKGIKYTKTGIELQLYDKISAINSLSGIMGWGKEVENNRIINDLSNFTDEQLKMLASSVEEVREIEEVKDNGDDTKLIEDINGNGQE